MFLCILGQQIGIKRNPCKTHDDRAVKIEFDKLAYFWSKPFSKHNLTVIVGVSMCIFHLHVAWSGTSDALTLRSIHLGFALVLAFLISPTLRPGRHILASLINLFLIFLSLSVTGYVLFEYEYLINRMMYVDALRSLDWVFGISAIVLIIEATRRVIGWTLPVTALGFIGYAVFFTEISSEQLIEQMYLGTQGIFGIPIYVSATYVVLFILFGALVERTGTGKLFMDFALSLTGRSPGGPAKVSCVTSGLFGTVSGSAVANVMTTGTFTIPLMKKIGYRPSFSGGVEAVASTGGQLMPPIMGAAAFIMAEFMGKSYLEIAKLALFPALLYYLALFSTVHFEAKRLGMSGLAQKDLPKLSSVIASRGHLFIPLLVVIGVLLVGFSPPFAALCGIASTLPTASLRKNTRKYVRWGNIIAALAQGAKNATTVALACACAGIVIGVIFITGLGLEFTNLVIGAASNHLVLALFLTMLAGIILGMGMPTAAAYIMQTALLVPALVKLGVIVEAAHMFVFFFAILSAITPPVALAVYAANGISQGTIWESSLAALRLGAAGYIIPFMFVFSPALLMVGPTQEIVLSIGSSALGVIALSAGLSGFFMTAASSMHRLALITSAVFLLIPGSTSDLVGLVLMSGISISQIYLTKND